VKETKCAEQISQMYLKSKKWKLKTEKAQRKLKLNIQKESGVFLRKKNLRKKRVMG